MASDPVKFTDVFQEELKDIRARREANGGPGLAPSRNGSVPTTKHSLTGLALSGGGLRAASVSLGVLQALNAKGVLKRIDYLSTVSGGGYIGTLMTISMSRDKGFPFGTEGMDPHETDATKHLRDNSRYLLQDGIRSVVSALAVYLRGITMNALILLPFIFAFSALLLYLEATRGAIYGALEAVLPLWWISKDAALPVTTYACMALLVLLVVYAIGVSVSRIMGIGVRRWLAWFASCVLFLFAAIAIVELHLFLLGKLFGPQQWNLQFEFLKTLSPVLASIAGVLLPFIKRLGGAAGKETGGTWSGISRRVLSSATLLFLAAIVPFLLWLGMMSLTHAGVASSGEYAFWYTATAIGLLLTWPFLSVNSNSLHQLYRDRLAAAFLMAKDRPDIDEVDNFCLSKVDPLSTPYHLINAALNVPGSKVANRRGRNADFFLFSRRYIGSMATGYVSTGDAERVVDRLNIGTAMAISGAAAAPNMGMASIKPLSPTIAFLNIRLGRWIKHPRAIANRAAKLTKQSANPKTDWWFLRNPWPHYLLREAFFKSGRNSDQKGKGFLFLSDGGHIENLGIYELLRRRCKLIIAVDAEADPNVDCGALVQLERFARIDFDTRITINWQPISAGTRRVGEQLEGNKSARFEKGPHVAVGVVDYPAPGDPKAGTARETGILVYVKASLSGDENDYIMSYKARYPRFPHETTADQLFSEEQLEVYRALGEHMTRRFLDGRDRVALYPEHRGLPAEARAMLMGMSVSGQLPAA